MKIIWAIAAAFLLTGTAVQAQEVQKIPMRITLPVNKEPVDFKKLDELMKKYKEKPFTLHLDENFFIGRIDSSGGTHSAVGPHVKGSGFGLVYSTRF